MKKLVQIRPEDLTLSKDKNKTVYDLIGKTIKNVEEIKRYTNDRVVVSCEDGTLFLLSSIEEEYEGTHIELLKIDKIISEEERIANLEERERKIILREIKDLENSKKRYANIDKEIEILKKQLNEEIK